MQGRDGTKSGGGGSTSSAASPPARRLQSAQVGPGGGRAPGAQEEPAGCSGPPPPLPCALCSQTPFFSFLSPLSTFSVFCLSPFLLSTQSYVIEVWMRNSQAEQGNCSLGRLCPVPPPRENTTPCPLEDSECSGKGLRVWELKEGSACSLQ